MGADIHMYVEYIDKERLEKSNKGEKDSRGELIKPYWRDFGGRINPGRNYWMFGFLSRGVRSYFSNGIPSKGLPPFNEMGYYSRIDSVCYISEKSDNDDDDKSVTLETALKWAESGRCKIIEGSNGQPTWVEHPDWHSHTWLTTDEYETAINNYKAECQSSGDYLNTPIEYVAILAAMKSFEENGYVARLVIWFDN
jgi:hypothetical protein